MKRILCAMTLCLITSVVVQAQTSPQKVAPGVISNGADYCSTLSPDGKSLYFARAITEELDAIMRSDWVNGSWSTPEKVSFTGTFSDTDPMLSPDGKSMYFMTDRKAEQDGRMDDYDIWGVDREGDDWGKPYRLPDYINTSFNEGFPSLTHTGDLYFFRSNRNGHTEQDIWYAPREGGGFDQPLKVRGGVNSEKWDGHPFVSPEGDFMIFYSSGREEGFGRCDLYISFNQAGGWQNPVNIGGNVNTSHCEMVPYVTHDKKTLYFSRIENGKRNIYQVDFQPILARFR